MVVPVSYRPSATLWNSAVECRVDRIVGGDAVLFVELLALVERDALLFDVVLVDPLVGVAVLPVVGGDGPADVVADGGRLHRIVEHVLSHDQTLDTGVDSGAVTEDRRLAQLVVLVAQHDGRVDRACGERRNHLGAGEFHRLDVVLEVKTVLFEQRRGDHVTTGTGRVCDTPASEVLDRGDAAVRLGHQVVAAAGPRIRLQPNGDEIGDAAVDGNRHRRLTDGADVGGARAQRLDHRRTAAEVRELHPVRGVLACVGEVPRQRLRGVLLRDDQLGAGRYVRLRGDPYRVDGRVGLVVGQTAGRHYQRNHQYGRQFPLQTGYGVSFLILDRVHLARFYS